MAIAHVASTTAISTGSGNTSLTITKPTGTADGHVLLAVLAFRGESGTVTPPTGWTLIRSVTGNESQLDSYWKAAGASEPADYTWSWVNTVKVAAGISTWSGVDTTTPVDISAGTNDGALNSDVVAPDATTTAADTRDIRAWSNDGSTTITPPATHPQRWGDATGGGGGSSNVTVAVGDRAFGTAGALGTATATKTTSQRDKAQTIALKPAAGGPTAVGKNSDLRWGVRSIVADNLDARWAVRQAVADTPDLRWAIRALATDDLDLRWEVLSALAAVGKNLDARWVVRAIAADAADLRWSVRQAVADSADLRWAVRQAIADELDARWLVRTTAGDSTDLRWGVRATAGDDADLRWALRALASDDIDLQWEVLVTLVADPSPRTLTIRDFGHTATARSGVHTATIRSVGHTATVREK